MSGILIAALAVIAVGVCLVAWAVWALRHGAGRDNR